MAKFVPDIKTQRWIIIAPVRWGKPDELNVSQPQQSVCPFCWGNENQTPPEIFRIGEGSQNASGWKIRVIPNKFPITDIHEVIIHSPQHDKDIEDFDISSVELLLTVYRSRFQTHAQDGQVMIFCNHGEQAGASLTHPHSQLVVIPRQINLDALVREPLQNIIDDNNFFVTYCPDFSQWPYEVWITPKKDNTVFSDISDDELKDLAAILQRALKKLKLKYDQPETKKIRRESPFAYNFYIHHAKNWFIRIIPRLIHRAGFELGTGLSVNIVDPSLAAKELKEIKI